MVLLMVEERWLVVVCWLNVGGTLVLVGVCSVRADVACAGTVACEGSGFATTAKKKPTDASPVPRTTTQRAGPFFLLTGAILCSFRKLQSCWDWLPCLVWQLWNSVFRLAVSLVSGNRLAR